MIGIAGYREPSDKSFDVEDWRESLFYHRFVLTVQVTARQRAPGVADDYAIWVQHRNYLYQLEHSFNI